MDRKAAERDFQNPRGKTVLDHCYGDREEGILIAQSWADRVVVLSKPKK